MGVRLWTSRAAIAIAVALALPVAPGWAATQVEPIARLTLEGGYDSNVRFDGSGGDRLARLSPEVGLRLRDHTWRLDGAYGGDLLLYQTLSPTRVWNHRGAFSWDARLERRLETRALANLTYAIDPVGLARLGIVSAGGEALIGVARARLSWRSERLLTLSATFQERLVRFPEGGGAVEPRTAEGGSAAHTPGIEAARRLSRRDEAGGAYRASFYRPFTGDIAGAVGHELKAFWRREVVRRVRVEVEAGPTFWSGDEGLDLVPEASASVYLQRRNGALRVMLARHLGVGSTASPSLNDALELGVAQRFGGPRGRLRLGLDAGVWRGSAVPEGGDAVTGLGGQTELAWALRPNMEIALAASHFQRADDAPERRRTTAGLRLGWRLPEH